MADDTPTVVDKLSATTKGSLAPVDVGEAPLDEPGEVRYRIKGLIGAGGMGEVRLCQDTRIAREVAVKVLHGKLRADTDLRERFVREARVQAQLEHPSIVPVYDVGLTAEGEPYFTMKRVRGVNLHDILGRLRAGDPEATRLFSRRKLLTAFSSVCLAVDFAHERGVLHRDLKPENFMLGNFGEVYVLDWGIAKLIDAPESPGAARIDLPAEDLTPTSAGTVLGTPTYMAPEQHQGHVDARSDVYALGLVLAEILTLETTHARGNRDLAEWRDLPPELVAVARRAMSREPADRFAGPRAVQEAVDRYLDGDRDLELRGRLAGEHAARAEEALAQAGAGGPSAAEARRRAAQNVGRVLGFDPAHAGGLRLLIRLLTDLPSEIPPEAAEALRASENQSAVTAARSGLYAVLAMFVLVPFVLWLGVRSWAAFELCVAALVGAAIVLRVRLEPWGRGSTGLILSFMIMTLLVASSSALLGPFIVTPGFAAAHTMAFVMVFGRRARARVVAVGCLTVVAPVLLEWMSAVPRSFSFEGGSLQVLPRLHAFPAGPTIGYLLVTNVALVVLPAMIGGLYRDGLRDAEQRLQLQAWQLRQLVPSGGIDAGPGTADAHRRVNVPAAPESERVLPGRHGGGPGSA